MVRRVGNRYGGIAPLDFRDVSLSKNTAPKQQVDLNNAANEVPFLVLQDRKAKRRRKHNQHSRSDGPLRAPQLPESPAGFLESGRGSWANWPGRGYSFQSPRSGIRFSSRTSTINISSATRAKAPSQWYGSGHDALIGKPTNRPPALALYNTVTAAAGCNVINVMLPTPDPSTWKADYDPSCTAAQIAAGNAAIAAFKPAQ